MVDSFTLLIAPWPAASAEPGGWQHTFRLVASDAPALAVTDAAASRGDGVFETFGVFNGHVQHVTSHLERFAESATALDLPMPNLAQFRAALAHAEGVLAGGAAAHTLRLVLSRGAHDGPTAWISVAPQPDFTADRRDGVSAVTLDRGYTLEACRSLPWLLLGAKTLSFAVNFAANREAVRRGASDAIFVTSDGYVLEAATATVIVRLGETYVTPVPDGSVLPGTTQRALFALFEAEGMRCELRSLTVDELRAADAAWLISSGRLMAPLRELDGVRVPVDAAATARFNAALQRPRD
ncbi:MAG TPA: aminotransferase class IV [Candidatus Lumbricidophila sp.]|nr:aminotransferase class IV [Candidatus Lumbricidophila sp.]